MANYSSNAKADKFYTDPAVALECIQKLNLDDYDLIIEPSAGSWAFSRHLPRDKTFSFDLFPDPEWPETIQQDWLEFNLIDFIEKQNAKNVLIIGNPPYGRLSGLAMQFVKHSCIHNPMFDIKTTVAFILSETFAKKSFMHRVPTTHTMTQHVSLGSPFTVDGEPYDALNTGWFVWEPIARTKEVITRSSDYLTFHKKDDFLKLETENKCAIRGQGSRAGHVFWENFDELSEATTRFCSGPGVHVLEDIDWSPYTKLTVGIPSLATSEIFDEVNSLMEK